MLIIFQLPHYWIVFQFSTLTAAYEFCEITASGSRIVLATNYCIVHFFKSDCFNTYLSWLT